MATLLAMLTIVLTYVMDFGLFSGKSISLERLDGLVGLIIVFLFGDLGGEIAPLDHYTC